MEVAVMMGLAGTYHDGLAEGRISGIGIGLAWYARFLGKLES
jgi:hypothetical protein